jgi:ornithine cyclodeaminase/alanine dehydrogenase
MGVKSYPVVRTDVTQGSVLTLLLYSMNTGELLAVIKADRLGQLRTGAASALATRVLARPEAEVLTVFGTGFQASAQVPAVAAVLPRLRAVNVVGRQPERLREFVARLRTTLDVTVDAVDLPAAVEMADVIITATGSSEPVLRGDWLPPGVHINAVGSNVAGKRELDRAALERAATIVVDDRDVAAAECGDLLANDWDQSGVSTLGDVVTGRSPGRRTAADITLFESQGLAVQDVVCAKHVFDRALEQGRGRRLTTPHS